MLVASCNVASAVDKIDTCWVSEHGTSTVPFFGLVLFSFKKQHPWLRVEETIGLLVLRMVMLELNCSVGL